MPSAWCTTTCRATCAARLEQSVGDAPAAIAAAPHRLSLDLTVERSASTPLEARGTAARWDIGLQAAAGLELHPDLHRRARGGRGQAGSRPGAGRRRHPRRRRRLRRQDHAPVAGGAARPDGGDGAGPAGEVHRGPARALRVERTRTRPGAARRGRVRRRRAAARAVGRLLARQRRLHAVRADRPDHHLHPAPRPLQARRLPGGLRVALHQHGHRHAVPRRRAPAGRLRDGAHDGRDRGVPRQGPRRQCARST